MRNIMVSLESGDRIATKINGTISEIVNYYFGDAFDTASIEFLDNIVIPWQEVSMTVKKIYKIPPEEMEAHELEYPLRACIIVHYPFDDLTTYCAYENGMFDPY